MGLKLLCSILLWRSLSVQLQPQKIHITHVKVSLNEMSINIDLLMILNTSQMVNQTYQDLPSLLYEITSCKYLCL